MTESEGKQRIDAAVAALVAGAFGALTEVYGDFMRAAGASARVRDLLAETAEIRKPVAPVALPEPNFLNRVALDFESRSNRNYFVWYTDLMVPSNWQLATPLTDPIEGDGQPNRFIDTLPNPTGRFYRLEVKMPGQ